MAKNNAKLYDVNLLISAGINPKTGLPYKYGKSNSSLFPDMKKLFRIKDEQSAVNRYKWSNSRLSLTSSEIERFFYYKFSLAFFRLEGKFYLMPYALDGGIDFYARENVIHPIPFADDTSESTKKQKELLSQIKLTVIKDEDDAVLADKDFSAVIIKDYTPQSNIQSGIPRATLQDSLIDFESQILPYMRTAMVNATGVQGVRASDSDEADDIIEASNSVNQAALNGTPWIPIVTKIDKSPLNNFSSFQAQNYLQALQGVDNLRESFYGTADKGVYTKAEHTNDSENEKDGFSSSPLLDGLMIRRHACDLINKIWNIGISVDINESASNQFADETMKGGNEDEPAKENEPTDIS